MYTITYNTITFIYTWLKTFSQCAGGVIYLLSGILRPIYTTEKVWHGSDKNGTRTKKIGSARINFAVYMTLPYLISSLPNQNFTRAQTY